MRRVIVEYAKLTNEILNLLVDKFPDGWRWRYYPFSKCQKRADRSCRSTYWRYNVPSK
jgi:hypothetical protein